MIIGFGAIFNQYIVLLLLSKQKSIPAYDMPMTIQSEVGKNKLMERIGIAICLVSIINAWSWMNQISENNLEISLMDGLYQITNLKLGLEIFIQVLAVTILLCQTQEILVKRNLMKTEMYLIFQSNLVGSISLLNSQDWVITLLSWELFNLSLYLLVSLNYSSSHASLSAAQKYFLQSAQSTGLFLLGIVIIYGITGSTQYDKIGMLQEYESLNTNYLQEIGFLLILGACLFKLAAAPLHNWAPDLYNAIQTPTTMWMMIIPKISVLGFLYIFWITHVSILSSHSLAHYLLYFVGITSLIIGALGLNSQWRIKRFLAYSSISHVGFILLGLYCNEYTAFLNYSFIYLITTINVFIILIIFSSYKGKEISYITDLRGLFRLNPYLSIAFTLAIFSLAGIPPLQGFFAKLLVIIGYMKYSTILAIVAIITSVISCARYLTLIKESQFSLIEINHYPKIQISLTLSLIISLITCILLLGMFKPLVFITLATSV